MRRTWMTGLPILLVPLLLGFSCGHSPDDSAAHAQMASSGNASLDPCQLVTQQQVAAAVGMSVDAGKPQSSEDSGSRGCTWTTAYGDAGRGPDSIASITVEVTGPNPALESRYPTARSYYDFIRHELYEDTAKDVKGIGDAAFLTSRDHWLYALKGDVLLRVFATFGRDAIVPPVLEQLMKDALGNV